MQEKDLYEPMRCWLHTYIEDKYPGFKVDTMDSSQIYLEDALRSLGIEHSIINGLQIQIDVLGVARKNDKILLFFVEAKKGTLILKDIGQLWIYSKLAQPEEAFLMTPMDFGSVGKVLKVLHRTELTDYSRDKRERKIRIVQWNVATNSPKWNSMI